MIETPISRLIQTLEAQSFTVIGCPSADGLGVEALQTYAGALDAAEGDFVVTLGDISPLGRNPYYRAVADFVNRISAKPVYVVPGEGDGPAFVDHFGHRNKAVIAEEFLLIMLDNAGRRFADESLAFLRDTLAIVQSPNIAVAFHHPPPNRFTGDAMSVQEWGRFEEAAGVWRKRIGLLVAGHAHTYFEDEVDGLRLVVTGGGGAAMADLDRVPRPEHHRVEFTLDGDGALSVVCKPVVLEKSPEREDVVEACLGSAFEEECTAFARHLLAAESAAKRGRPNLARLFRAAAESRFRQVGNLRRVMEGADDPLRDLRDFAAGNGQKEQAVRVDCLTAAERSNDYLVMQAFRDLAASQIVNLDLMERARGELSSKPDIEWTGYHVCLSCGIVFDGDAPPEHCSECGAPDTMIHEIR